MRAIALGGLVVGILDLAYAIVVYSPHHPILVPQTIASGVLGAASYGDGTWSLVLGVVLHFCIATGAAAVYYAFSRKLPIMIDHPIWSGIVFGTAVYCFMHAVVLPLSAANHRAIPPIYVVTELIEHWFFVGMPIAFIVRWQSSTLR